MGIFEGIDKNRKTAIYIRISTAMQQTDRQREELLQIAKNNDIRIEEKDIYTDIISGFKDGEVRPAYVNLKQKVEDGEYSQILFSEFSRLDRKPSNLLKSIEYYQQKGVYLYFAKQGICVKEKNDMATSIMISVLAVMSQYEIELFVSRGIDGKISAIRNRGISSGGFCPYGYQTVGVEKKLCVKEEEAEIVRRIFNLYLNGKSSLEIADILNTENIPTSYSTRVKESKQKRESKGLSKKKYSFDENKLKWRASTINRLLKNQIYIGKRDSIFHYPDPANPIPIEKRKDRVVMEEVHTEDASLIIVGEDIFFKVQSIIKERAYNRNNAVRHDNLLKPLLRCGECGSRYTVGGGVGDRKYKCYGKVQRADKVRTCADGTEVQMKRLDGLVAQLCIRKFADYDLKNEITGKLAHVEDDIKEKSESLISINEKIECVQKSYTQKVSDILEILSDDKEQAKVQIDIQRSKNEKEIQELKDRYIRLEKSLAQLKGKRQSLNEMMKSTNLISRQNDIMKDRALLREYVYTFITEITLYRMSKQWSLVIIHFFDGGEMWGTIKNSRYKNEELFFDPVVCSVVEYQSWFINNQELSLSYDAERKMISYNGKSKIIGNDFNIGEYTAEEFDKIVREKGWYGSFPPYNYEIQ